MQEKNHRRSNAQRSETMRAELVSAARALFVEKGYAETSTPDIVAAAGVTRGALYHHFEDKKALFAAVIQHEAADLAAAIQSAGRAGQSPRNALIEGGEAFLAAMRVPGRVRLMLVDAPAVLEPALLASIDAANGAATLAEGLELASRSGQAPPDLQIAPLADLLSAAYDRAALAIDGGADPLAYRQALSALIDGVLRRV